MEPKVRLCIVLTVEEVEAVDKMAKELNLSRSVTIGRLILGQHNNSNPINQSGTLTEAIFMEGINKVIESNTKDRNSLFRDLKEIFDDLQIMGKPTNKVEEIIEESVPAE